jgi:hypothetical protein
MKKISFIKFFSSANFLPNIIFRKSRINVILILFFCVFIFSILSGCNESLWNNNNDSNPPSKVKILGYNVTTEWSTGCTCDNTYENHVETGFYHTAYLRYNANYSIKGEIKNIAEKKIDMINININFLDENGTVLFDTELLNATYKIYNLSKGDTKSFLIKVNPELYNYFDDPDFYNKLREKFQIVESLEFDISTL